MRLPTFIFASVALAAAASASAQTKPAAPSKPAPKTTPAPSAAVAADSRPPSTSTLPLIDEDSRTSYVVGVNIGSRLRNDGVPLVLPAFDEGLKDGLAKARPRFTDEQMAFIVSQLQAKFQEHIQEQMAALAKSNEEKGEAFLKGNAAKPGVKTLPDGLQYQVLAEGRGPKPGPDDVVTANYAGTLLDGTEFDSSYKRGGPAELPLSGVIKGWSEALQLMPVGSKWRLFVPSSLAYGAQSKGAIGPNAALIFEVELVSIKPKG